MTDDGLDRVSLSEFEVKLELSMIKLTAVTKLQVSLLPMIYPGTAVSEEVTHTYNEIGPGGRQRLHLIELPEQSGVNAIVRLLDVIPRERLMVPSPGEFK